MSGMRGILKFIVGISIGDLCLPVPGMPKVEISSPTLNRSRNFLPPFLPNPDAPPPLTPGKGDPPGNLNVVKIDPGGPKRVVAPENGVITGITTGVTRLFT